LRNRQTELEKIVQERTATISAQAEELRTLDKIKSRFFANVSHELRTPLTLILSPIQTVLKRNQLTNKDYTYLSTAQRNSKRLLRLINEILDLTKLESGKLEVQNSTVVLYNFLKKIIASFESHAETQQIQLHFQYQLPNHIQVALDAKKTEIIIINLLSNALKFTPIKGKVTLSVKSEANNLQFIVKDTGRGIHPDDLPHIFNRFYQTKNKNTAAEGGTGIGLALSQEFAKLMDGALMVESELFKGSIFTLVIPKVEVLKSLGDEDYIAIQEEETDEKEEKTLPIISNKNENRPTLLLVEDNHDLQNFIKSILEEKYNVITANNGKEALEQLGVTNSELHNNNSVNPRENSSHPVIRYPQLILSDIMMPIMDGYQLLETLKSSKDYRHLPVIILTARAAQDDKLKALRIGVDDYLLKPFDEEELLVRIENLITNSKNRSVLQVADIPKVTKNTSIQNEEDLEWLATVEDAVLAGMSNFDYSVNDLINTLPHNRWQLNDRLKSVTGLTARQYIQEVRLTKARQLLENREVSAVKTAVYSVGMKDTKYFTRLFKKRFGRTPSSFL
jgi:CheY-like chemotaxis protein/nitrogen-specific signal transduction histidine kinase